MHVSRLLTSAGTAGTMHEIAPQCAFVSAKSPLALYQLKLFFVTRAAESDH